MFGRRKFLKAGAVGGAVMLPPGVLGARAYAATTQGAGCPDIPVTHTPPLKRGMSTRSPRP
ncbi:twin-arginine translocation signal domain-containing protein [Streptomyces sp. NPDC005498]|uniref:twin-arginine translocation signal domain-containing protein n=1 Tax=Streptomyces sp. NPDC005498 TaxID=3364717 RepID=UPI0036BA1EC9